MAECCQSSRSGEEAVAGTSTSDLKINKVSEVDEKLGFQSQSKQTVIRLKRRIDDSPSKILVLSFKRTKLEEGVVDGDDDGSILSESGESKGSENDQVCSQVLRLIGTLAEDEADNNNIEMTIRNALEKSRGSLSKSSEPRFDFRKNVKTGTTNTKVTDKVRKRFKKNSENGRFKLVTSKRGIDVAEDEAEWKEQQDLLKLLDLVPDSDAVERKKRKAPEGFEPGNVTCNGRPMIKEINSGSGTGISNEKNDKGFVYDLYLTNSNGGVDFDFGKTSQIVNVEEGDDELDFGEYRDNVDEEDRYMEDDDSNAEDNYRNDYPDSEEEGLIDDESYGAKGNSGFRYVEDDEIYGNFKDLNMGGDSSSDDDLIYGIDDDGENHGMSFDQTYARYKKRVLNEFADEVVSLPSSEDEDY